MVWCVTIRKLIAELVGAAFNARLTCPPPTNVIDGGKYLPFGVLSTVKVVV
jgi:hypothetical protein